MEPLLVIDDDPGFRKLLETILAGEQYQVVSGGSVADARRLGSQRQFDLVISDLRLPDGDGIEVVRWFKDSAPSTAMIVITAFGSIANAVEAMKSGAAGYIGKPLASPEELRLLVRRTLDQSRIARELDALLEEQSGRSSCDAIVARDPRTISVLGLARQVAHTHTGVLITGPAGSGKETLARCIHQNSLRRDRIFVAVNCAALSPALMEGELFGHERAEHAGATSPHIGRLERAHGGTLFLDEVGVLDPALQVRLSRVLQDGVLERQGGTRHIPVDVRVIAATTRDLNKAVAEGAFRAELFYRLNTSSMHLPALTDRSADIPPLAEFFLKRACGHLGKPEVQIGKDAMDILLAYRWPGDVRELENLMERLAILCDHEVKASDLPLVAPGEKRLLKWKDIERKAIEEALRSHHGNRTQAARQLGISLRTLQYRLKEYSNEPPKDGMSSAESA